MNSPNEAGYSKVFLTGPIPIAEIVFMYRRAYNNIATRATCRVLYTHDGSMLRFLVPTSAQPVNSHLELANTS